MKRKALFLPLLLILCVLVWSQGTSWYWRTHPEQAFGKFTGKDLPKGVQVTAYASEVTDNFFHQTHYWIVFGPPELLQEVITSHPFQQSEDAVWNKPDAGRLFDNVMKNADLVDGYEREDNGRNRWLWISLDKSFGLYAY